MSTFRGIMFPFQKGSVSFPAGVEDAELIRQSIIQILLTEKGERVMRPDFGSGVLSRVFDNNDALTASLMQAEISSAIGRWEPRVIVQGVSIVQDDANLTVTVNYVIIATRQQDSVSLQLATPQ